MAQIRGSERCRGTSDVPPPSGSSAPPPPAGGGTGVNVGSSSGPGEGGTAGTGGSGGTGGTGGVGGMTDVLQYMIPPASWSQNNHLASKQAGVNPQFVVQTPLSATNGWIYYIKNPGGYPWDINYYDSNYVYQVITEGPSGWTDPSSYKIFVSSSWPSGRGGIAWSPRYIGPAPFENFLLTEDSSYQTWLGGVLQATQNLATVATLCQGPFNLAVGDLGTIPVIIVSYQWGSGLKTQEQTWYGFQLGVVRWQEYTLTNGVYKLTTDNIFDQRKPGGSPPPVFEGTLP